MGASLESHDTGDNHQLGVDVLSTQREYVTAGAVTLDSLTVSLTYVLIVCLASASLSASVAIRGDLVRRIR